MSAIPDPDPTPDDQDHSWYEEWDPWGALDLIERREREGQQWWRWAGRLLAVGLLLPLVMVALVALLILIF